MVADDIHQAHKVFHAAIESSVPFMIDLLDADVSKLRDHDIHEIVEHDSALLKRNPSAPIGIVTRSFYIASSNESCEEFTGLLGEGIRVFDSMVIARAWLEQDLFSW